MTRWQCWVQVVLAVAAVAGAAVLIAGAVLIGFERPALGFGALWLMGLAWILFQVQKAGDGHG